MQISKRKISRYMQSKNVNENVVLFVEILERNMVLWILIITGYIVKLDYVTILSFFFTTYNGLVDLEEGMLCLP